MPSIVMILFPINNRKKYHIVFVIVKVVFFVAILKLPNLPKFCGKVS